MSEKVRVGGWQSEVLHFDGCCQSIEKMMASLRRGEADEDLCRWLVFLIKEEMRDAKLTYVDVDFDEAELNSYIERFTHKNEAEKWIMQMAFGHFDFDTCQRNIDMHLQKGKWSLCDVGVQNPSLQEYYDNVITVRRL